MTVSPLLPDNSLTMAEKNELKFEVLSDAGNKVAREYGLVWTLPEPLREVYKGFGVDVATSNGTDSWELPIPGTYVIAKDGTVKLAFAEANYTVRLEPAAILDALNEL